MQTVEKKLEKIMSCDAYVAISSENISYANMQKDLSIVEKMLRDFEKKYTRFDSTSELCTFNDKEGNISLDSEFIDILSISQRFNHDTNGVFDISLLPYLQQAGYQKSKYEGFVDSSTKVSFENNYATIKDLKIFLTKNVVNKPNTLKVDFGGLGKGYAIDKAKNYLALKYKDFCIEIGGDMFVSGVDMINNYAFWAITIDNPETIKFPNKQMPTLIVSNKGVATSGVDKRNWIQAGIQKNHLIDPYTKDSIANNLICVTVVAHSAVEADIWAKTLLILGQSEGLKTCENKKISAIFVDNKLNFYMSSEIIKYVWKE